MGSRIRYVFTATASVSLLVVATAYFLHSRRAEPVIPGGMTMHVHMYPEVVTGSFEKCRYLFEFRNTSSFPYTVDFPVLLFQMYSHDQGDTDCTLRTEGNAKDGVPQTLLTPRRFRLAPGETLHFVSKHRTYLVNDRYTPTRCVIVFEAGAFSPNHDLQLVGTFFGSVVRYPVGTIAPPIPKGGPVAIPLPIEPPPSVAAH